MAGDESHPPTPEMADPSLTKVRMDPARAGMATVSFLALDRQRPCLCDIFLPVVDPRTKAVEMKLICAQGQSFKTSWWKQMEQAGLRSVCVRVRDVALLLDDMAERGSRLLANQAVPARAKAMYIKEMAAMNVQALFAATGRDQEHTEKACGMARQTISIYLKHEEVVENLSSVLVTSRTIYDHSVNVCLMSLVLGRQLGLDRSRLLSLGQGALLHDLGMTRVPPEIRDQPGELSPEQRALVQKHPSWGHQALSMIDSVPYDALNIVLNHHERADGQGYPNRLSGEDIPALVRMVKVVDAYDAMTSPRPHRPALPPAEAAANLLEQAGPNLDREFTVEFLRMHSQAFR